MADTIDALAEKAVRDATAATQAAIAKEAPPYVRASIVAAVTGSGRAAKGQVQARGLSPIVLAGQRAHAIEPRATGGLFWPGAEHPIGRARHPMVPANDFVTRGLAAADKAVDLVADAAAEAIADQMAAAVAD